MLAATQRAARRAASSAAGSAFPTISAIKYDPKATNFLSFKHYNADEVIEGRVSEIRYRWPVCARA
jgi:xylose isomerase